MPLESVNVDLPLPGLKQSSDARVAPVEGAAKLRNYFVERFGALRRRSGFAGPAFASGIPIRATPLPLGGLHVLRADTTCVTTTDQGATLSQPQPTAAGQQERNFAPLAVPEVIAREAFLTQGTTFERSQAHAARTQNFLVIAGYVTAIAGQQEVVFSVYDANGGLLIAGQRTGIVVLPSAAHLVLLAEQTNDNIVLVNLLGSTDVRARRFTVSAAGCTLTTQASLATLGGAFFLWDAAISSPNVVWIAFDNNGAPGISIQSYNATTFALTGGLALPGTVRPQALSIHILNARMAIASVDQGTNAQRGTLVDITGPSVVGTFLSGATPADVRSVAACVVNPAATGTNPAAVYLWSAETDNAIVPPISGVLTTRARAQGGAGAAIGTGATWVGVRPAAKPFPYGGGLQPGCAAFFDILPQRAAGSTFAVITNPDQPAEPGFATVLCQILSITESGIAALAASPEPLAWHNLSRAGSAVAASRLAASTSLSDGTVLSCLTALDRAEVRYKVSANIVTGASALTTRAMVVRYSPTPSGIFAAVSQPRTYAVAGATAMIACAAPYLAQGRGVTPAGYLHPPEIMGARQTVTGVSPVWPDTFISIRARYVWYDGRGNEMVSPWSLPSQIATPTAVANTRIDIYLRNPFAWPGDSTSERHPLVEVAVASGNATTFRRTRLIDLNAAASGPFNLMPTSVAASLALGLRPDNITGDLVNVTDLANDPPPACSYVAAGQSRHLLVGVEDEAVYFSKPAIVGVLPEWSLAFVLAPSGSTGRPVAAVEINDQKLLIGDAGACYYVGDGPLADGSGAFFSGPYEAARGHGCVSASSVCQSPGIAFWRTKHTIVAYSGQVEVIGRDVQDELDAMPFTLASCYDPTLNAALWLVADEFNALTAILIYDLTHKAWFVWDCPGLGVLSDLAADETGLYLTGGSKTTRYDAEGVGDGFDAGTTNFSVGRARSQAARLSSINGFQRVWAVEVKYESFEASNTLTLRCYRDGKATPDPDIVSQPLGFGVDIVKFHLPANRQRCSTMEIELEDAQPNGPDVTPAGVSILGVTLRIAGKKGIRTVPRDRRA